MSRNFYFLLAASILSLSAAAQNRAVVASAGGESQSGKVNLNWTLGETAVATVSLPKGELLTEGFQQPDILRVEPAEAFNPFPASGAAPAEAITIAPNPVSTALSIQIPGTWSTEALAVELFDANARKIENGRIEPGVATAAWNMSGYPAGTYWLRIVAPGARQTQTFKVIKIQ